MLICRECQYAIQKSAVQSHLLRHKIYRDERRLLLSAISQFDLLEPHLVPLPDSASPPIDGLPIISGYCCTEGGCGNLCASSKRMKHHHSEVHGHSAASLSSFSRPVNLQTFFRGTKIRYFEVQTWAAQSGIAAEQLESAAVSDDDGHDEVFFEQGHTEQVYANDTTIAFQPRAPKPLPLGNLDLETLTYFHHFTTVTSLTLPGSAQLQPSTTYWQTDVVLQALQHRWLMYGLLAISAGHLAILTEDLSLNLVHRRRSAQFWTEFSAGRDKATNRDSGIMANGEDENVRKTGDEIRSLLHCTLCALKEPSSNQGVTLDPTVSLGLQTIVAIIRVLFNQDAATRISRVGGDDDIHPENIPEYRDLQQSQSSSEAINGGILSTNHKTPPEMLGRLHTLPYRMAGVFGRPDNAQDVLNTLRAISLLVECCDISFASEDPGTAWRGMARWVAKVPDHFNSLITRHNPPALIVLAHWAQFLLKRAENCGCWFLKNVANTVLAEVAKQLDSDDSAVRGLLSGL